jgi:hypothetical protein
MPEQIQYLWPILILMNFLSVPVFILLVRNSPKALIAVFLLLMIGLEIIAAFFGVWAFGGAFGPGLILFCSSLLGFPMAGLIWLGGRRFLAPLFQKDDGRKKIYTYGGTFIICLQLVPMLGQMGINSGCYAVSRNQAGPVIEALEAYLTERGMYPDHLDELVPDYLPDLPRPACKGIAGSVDAERNLFSIRDCDPAGTIIAFPSTDGAGIKRYQLDRGRWSSASFLDGACSHLE